MLRSVAVFFGGLLVALAGACVSAVLVDPLSRELLKAALRNWDVAFISAGTAGLVFTPILVGSGLSLLTGKWRFVRIGVGVSFFGWLMLAYGLVTGALLVVKRLGI